MENQILSEGVEKKKPLFRLFVITAIILAFVFVGYFIFGEKIIPKEINAGNATLSWDANTESDLAGYKIYYGTSTRTGDCPPADYLNKVDVGKTETPDKPSFVLKDLQKGKIYYFSITSYDISGNESCFSAEISKTIN